MKKINVKVQANIYQVNLKNAFQYTLGDPILFDSTSMRYLGIVEFIFRKYIGR